MRQVMRYTQLLGLRFKISVTILIFTDNVDKLSYVVFYWEEQK